MGSETSGSILTPAAFCGVTGLRPTYGLVSRHGAMALCWTLDKLGPLARSADDCGLVLSAIAGHDPRDPTTGEVILSPLNRSFEEWLRLQQAVLPRIPQKELDAFMTDRDQGSATERDWP